MTRPTTAVRPEPVLALCGVSLEFPTYRGRVQALSEVSLQVGAGEIVALVGESGSGKSVAAMAAIRLLPPRLYEISRGSITVVGRDMLGLPDRAVREIRGKRVSMVFQEPMGALNPTMRIGTQIIEVLRRHEVLDRATAAARAAQLLSEMRVADPARVMRSYAFQLSGGMRQRVLMAMAFACDPQLLIADEPTTALDVTVQAQVLALIRERSRAHGTAVLLISHDLAVVSQLCDRVYVMYAGQIVEWGPVADVLGSPLHPYTRALLSSLPDAGAPGRPLTAIAGTVPSLLDPPSGCRFRARCAIGQPRCAESPPPLRDDDPTLRGAACWFAGQSTSGNSSGAEAGDRAQCAADRGDPQRVEESRALLRLEGVEVRFAVGKNWLGRPTASVHAVNGVDLEVLRGETLAIVGESGCGKSTLAHLVMALLPPTVGRVQFDGVELARLSPAERRRMRHRFQMVFQDPQASLDPRMRAWQVISEPLTVARQLADPALRRRAVELAALVGIRDEQLERFPHEFSGGQRQRLAIARALALEPELLVLDEPTSALDVSIQAQILNLLMELQSRLRLTYLFISHNVAVVRHLADRVAVMYLGQIVELGPCGSVIADPKHPYTRQLIGAVPRLRQPWTIPPPAAGDPPSNVRLPAGCLFRARCAWADEECAMIQELRVLADGRWVRCHRAEIIEDSKTA